MISRLQYETLEPFYNGMSILIEKENNRIIFTGGGRIQSENNNETELSDRFYMIYYNNW